MGYNIGGIAGSQVGYIKNCENKGQVLGRKEVGGIVGQMEPVANLEFNADTLQILEGQLSSAAGKIKSSSEQLQSKISAGSTDVSSQIGKLQNELNNTGDAVTQLLKDIEVSAKETSEKNNKKDSEESEKEDKETSEEKEWYERLMEWEDLSLPDADNVLAARSSFPRSS